MRDNQDSSPSRATLGAARDLTIAAGLTAIAAAASFVLLHTAGPKAPGYAFLFLLAIMAAAWRGFAAGIAATLLSFYVVPFFFNPHFKLSSVDPARLVMTLLVCALISAIAHVRRRAETALRRKNEELDRGVNERAAELEQKNRELAQREEELRTARSQLSEVLDRVSESFLALDREWRFTYANSRIARSLGLSPEEVIGRSIWDLFPDAVDSEFYTNYQRVMNERVPLKFEMYYPARACWYEVNAQPASMGITALVSDITERKRDEAEVARLASIVESSSDAIASKNLDGIILTWNGGAERMYGYTPQEAVGQSMQIIVPEHLREEEAGILARLRQGERVDHFETARVRKDGTQLSVSLTISPIRSRDGQIIGASHVSRDITDQKNFHAQIQQVQKLESLGVLAGGIAHDFNNLLVGILGNASLAIEDAPPENQKLLSEIVRAGERAADLTSQLLAYAGKGKFFIQPIDLSALVEEISDLIRMSISASVRLELDLRKDLPCLEGDVGQIQQIVMNLVINAAEAIGGENTGVVWVSTRLVRADEQMLSGGLGSADPKPGTYILLEVRDSGCGMSPLTLSRIFDPFFTTKFTGRGLGLSAVLGIVGGHRGVLKVESEPEHGTAFRIFLPAAATRAVQERASTEAANLRGAGSILVVDDEEIVRQVARGALERFGYTVCEANNGREALDIFARNPEIRLVILDLTMPLMGGEEALPRLREIRSEVPVILSSGFSESEALRRFEGKGIAGFIQKPYTASRLGEKVRGALSVNGGVYLTQ